MARSSADYTDSLFAQTARKPLAELLRPTTLPDVIGQDHLLGPGKPLEVMARTGRVRSMILWGPPGTGKTTIAEALAGTTRAKFVKLSAISAGVAEVRKVFEEAKAARARGEETILFLDECHRWSKSQQDTLLENIERGVITLIGATTENPSFAMNAAINSRARTYVINPLGPESLELLVQRTETHFGRPLPVTPEARDRLIQSAGTDGRFLLGQVEAIFEHAPEQPLTVETLGEVIQARLPLYDRASDAHYNLLSCFHKACRGSDPDAAMYWAARMIRAGEPPETILRRLAAIASEDVGLADPQAMVQVLTAWQLFERLGWPEGRIPLAQAINYVASAPKSNASYVSINEALRLADETASLEPPMHLRNAPTSLMKSLGYKVGYVYDHDAPRAFSGQEFFPQELTGPNRPVLYRPTERGHEAQIGKRLGVWRARRAQVQGETQPDSGSTPE